ncbi:hypothetical protein D9615_005734 [Tricholomella constricta]|uniref:F-box domain-containing protein n=1 Tax=Tricholomella constricta TaxID=117010 RepID=A0A8H5M399_9AGAR|nr:hypothetical protein D9615_005734 [Tricholomella constricta]
MNTTHRAPRKVWDLPDLPPELWLSIFRIATWVPSIMDPEATLEFSLTFSRERKRLYRKSLVTKRYLVRVCKQWKAWASPYLYESIYLGRGKSLRPLRDALMRSQQDEHVPDEDHPLGWWTKRLDLALRDMSITKTDRRDEIRCISDIVQCLPNLNIVNFSVTAPPFHRNFQRESFPSSVIHSLADWSGPSLQAITWQGSFFTPDPQDWHAFLAKAKNLRTLRCPDFLEGTRLPCLTLLSLESLYPQKEPLMGDFPSLRHLTAEVSPSTGWQPLLESHGAKLEIVQLSFKYHSTMSPVLTLLSASCPKLVRLDLSVTSWDLVGCQVEGCELVLPSTVRVMGLQNTSKQSSPQGYKSLFWGLEQMTFGSSLDYVQLIDSGNVADLRQKHSRALMRGLAMLHAKGLQLRDHEGLVMR